MLAPLSLNREAKALIFCIIVVRGQSQEWSWEVTWLARALGCLDEYRIDRSSQISNLSKNAIQVSPCHGLVGLGGAWKASLPYIYRC
jgi:hypothetical protein